MMGIRDLMMVGQEKIMMMIPVQSTTRYQPLVSTFFQLKNLFSLKNKFED